MTDWATFATAEPAFANRVRAILTSTTNCVLGTIRADGSPRLSGIDPFFVEDVLYLGSMEGARKAADLHRDPRMSLHAVPWESRLRRDGAADPGDVDAKLTGLAIPIVNELQQSLVIAALAAERGFDPPAGGDLFAIDLTSAVTISVEDDHLVVDRWTPGDGRVTIRRT